MGLRLFIATIRQGPVLLSAQLEYPGWQENQEPVSNVIKKNIRVIRRSIGGVKIGFDTDSGASAHPRRAAAS
jgi:hypothetical protein